MKKRCTKCRKLKALELFSKKCKHRLSSWCKVCHSEYSKVWNEANPGKNAATSREWNEANPSRHAATTKQWRKDNPGKTVAFTQARRAAKLKAIPPWLTEKDFKAIDRICAKAVKLGLTVDHIIPLRGKGVCGLHVLWNLQLLTESANSKKGRKFFQGWITGATNGNTLRVVPEKYDDDAGRAALRQLLGTREPHPGQSSADAAGAAFDW